jgi:hypothetical protein
MTAMWQIPRVPDPVVTGSIRCIAVIGRNGAKDRNGWRIQPVDVTHSLNISAGV